MRGRYGRYTKTTYKGGLRDFSFTKGASIRAFRSKDDHLVWSCSHEHPARRPYKRGKAIQCARRELRRLQGGRADWKYPYRPKFDVSHLVTQGNRVSLPPVVWSEMVAAAQGMCFYCGAQAVVLEADHVVPVSRGGTSAYWNFVVSCAYCNRRKANKTGREFVVSPSAAQLEKFNEVDRKIGRPRPTAREIRRLHREQAARRRRLPAPNKRPPAEDVPIPMDVRGTAAERYRQRFAVLHRRYGAALPKEKSSALHELFKHEQALELEGRLDSPD